MIFSPILVTLATMLTAIALGSEPNLVQTNLRECNITLDWVETIDVGWPLVIDCTEAIFLFSSLPEDENDDRKIECIYVDKDNDKVLMSHTVDMDDVLDYQDASKYVNPSMDEKAPVNYQVIVKMKEPASYRCASYNIQIDLTPFVPQTCEESLLKGERRTEIVGRYQNTKLLDCKVPEAEELSVHVNSSEEIEMNWYRNCTKYPPNTFSDPKDLKLQVRNIEFEHAGIYTCAVTYNGMTKYIVHYQMCITHGQQGMKPEILCPSNVLMADLGEDVVMEIDTIAGMGTVNDYDYTGHWHHLANNNYDENIGQNSLCFISKAGSKENSTEGQRIQCELDFKDDKSGGSLFHQLQHLTKKSYIYFTTFNRSQSSEEQKCFLYVANVEERIRVKNSFMSTLHIRDVQKKDYGNYSYTMKVVGHEPSTLCYVTLVPRKKSTTKIIISVIILLVITSLSTLLIHYFQIYIKVYLKRKFKKTHKDSCQVFLSYRYSSNMDESTKTTVKNAVQSIEAILVRLGCKVFDENRDGTISEYQSNSIQNTIAASDRVVVILASPDYIEDNWSVFKFQRCFEKTIETKSKLILVLGPGMKKYIKESSKFNETCFLVRRVMNISHVVEWTEAKKDSRRLNFEMEYAIPKIRKSDPDSKNACVQEELIGNGVEA